MCRKETKDGWFVIPLTLFINAKVGDLSINTPFRTGSRKGNWNSSIDIKASALIDFQDTIQGLCVYLWLAFFK